MFKEQVLNFCTIIGGITAIGVFFDSVLITDEQKKQLAGFLKGSKHHLPFDQAFYHYIHLINDSVFDRFFRASFFSWRYFLSTSVLSICFLLIVLTAEFLANPNAFSVFPATRSEFLVLAICIVSNLVIDWISIGQTQAFFRISGQLKSVSHSTLLIVSDFILAINFFILFFSITLAGLVALADSPVISMKIKPLVFSSGITSSEAQTFASWTGGMLRKPRRATFLVNENQRGRSVIGTIIAVSDTDSFNLKDVVNLGVYSTGARAWASSEILSPSDFLPKKPVSNALLAKIRSNSVVRGSAEWHLLDDAGWSEHEALTVWSGHRAAGINKTMAYTVAYQAAETVQLSFPESMGGNLMTVDLGKLLSAYRFAASARPEVSFACGRTLNGRNVWAVSDFSAIFGQSCSKRVSYSAGQIASLVAQMHVMPGSVAETLVPLNSFFMTSMAMTLIVYAFTIFLIVAKVLSATFLSKLSFVGNVLIKAPLGSAGFAIGFVLYLMTLVFHGS